MEASGCQARGFLTFQEARVPGAKFQVSTVSGATFQGVRVSSARFDVLSGRGVKCHARGAFFIFLVYFLVQDVLGSKNILRGD